MDGVGQRGGGPVHADLRDAFSAEWPERIIRFNEAYVKVTGKLLDHGRAVGPEGGRETAALFIEDHFLVEGVPDGFEHSAVDLALRQLGIDGRAAVRDGVIAKHRDCPRARVHGHLAEMGGVRKCRVIRRE